MADEQIPAGGGAPAAPEAPKVVALENFQAVVQAKQGLEAQVGQLKTQLQAAIEKAATADALTRQVEEWRGKAAEAECKFQTYTEFSGVLGSTSTKVINIFDQEYRTLPEADRPSRKAWVEALRAAPDQAPEHLAPWLVAGAGNTAAGAPKPPAPKVPGTPATPPSAPSSVSPEEVRRIREECVRTGNWEPWKAIRRAHGVK